MKKVDDRLADVSLASDMKQVCDFSRRNQMSYGMCVMKWLIAKTDNKNKRMPKVECVLRVIRSEITHYLMLKIFLRM